MSKRKQATPRPRSEKPYQVFVSHATSDKWLAKVLCDKIEAAGARSFRDDRDVNGGDDIPEEIRKQIKRSQEIVVLLTPESINRTWVMLEIGAAWGRSKSIRILIVMCHVSVDTIPDMIKNKKAVPLNEVDQYLNELAHRVRGQDG